VEPWLSLRYDGPAVADGRISVWALGSALVALEDILQEADHLLNNRPPEVHLEIVRFSQGSVEVVLALVQAAAEHVIHGVETLTSDPAFTALSHLMSTVTALFGVIKLARKDPYTNNRLILSAAQCGG
jgi:hypothetical protein